MSGSEEGDFSSFCYKDEETESEKKGSWLKFILRMKDCVRSLSWQFACHRVFFYKQDQASCCVADACLSFCLIAKYTF